MSTHLSRVGYWLQHGSFFPWPTSRVLQLIYPLDAQLQMYWTVLFIHSDALVGFVQWTAALACGVGIFALARFLGWSRPQSAFAALVFPGFPLVLLQSTTTQNDLVIAALALPALYFLLLGLKTGQNSLLLLAGLSLGLALGTKQSSFFILVSLLIILALVWLKERKGMLRPLARWLGYTMVCFLLFSAYQYVINWVNFGSPMGPSRVIDDSLGGQDISWAGGNVFYNAPRLVYQSLDVSGLPNPLDGLAYKVKAYSTAWLVKQIGYQIEGTLYTTPPHEFVLLRKTENQEDQAWYGPLSVLLLFPAMTYQFVNGLRKREPVRVGVVVVAILFLLVDAWLRPGWDPFQGRYFAPVFALSAPLMAGIVQPNLISKVFRWFAVGLALVVMTVTMLYNPAKPLAGKKARNVDIWIADRATVQTIQGFFSRDLLRMVERVVPVDATLGLYTPGYVWDYPFFGKHFTRRLVPIYPFVNSADLNWLEGKKIEWILVQKGVDPAPALPKEAEQQATVEGWALYRINR
jgi:4-amino-4-deoxy-L-arabinose transferase-like glycosyltransferase